MKALLICLALFSAFALFSGPAFAQQKPGSKPLHHLLKCQDLRDEKNLNGDEIFRIADEDEKVAEADLNAAFKAANEFEATCQTYIKNGGQLSQNTAIIGQLSSQGLAAGETKIASVKSSQQAFKSLDVIVKHFALLRVEGECRDEIIGDKALLQAKTKELTDKAKAVAECTKISDTIRGK